MNGMRRKMEMGTRYRIVPRFAILVLVAALVTTGWPTTGSNSSAGDTILNSKRIPVMSPGEAVDLSQHKVVLMFDDGWHCIYTDAYPLLKAHGMKAVLPLISDYVGSGKPNHSGNPYGYMNRAEIQEMIDSLGVEIASHTKTHPWLTRLSDEAARAELIKSRQALETMFHQDIVSFVYPYGDYNSRIRSLVAEAGYTMARSISPGTVNFSERPFDLPSSEITRTTPLSLVRDWIVKRSALILFLHRVVPGPNYRTDWSTGSFAKLLDWLDLNDVQVVTLKELYQIYQGKLPERLIARRSWKNRIEWSLLQEINPDVTALTERR
jgi:peptidoglycan/xylan/chitin deacetylase (PgdA/CDA1 family)